MNIAEVTDIISSFSSQQKSLFADWNMTVFTYTASCLGESLKHIKEEQTRGVEAYMSANTLFILPCDITGTWWLEWWCQRYEFSQLRDKTRVKIAAVATPVCQSLKPGGGGDQTSENCLILPRSSFCSERSK